MSWLKKTIRDWLTRDKLAIGPYDRVDYNRVETAPRHPRSMAPYSFALNIMQASNGHVLEIVKFDPNTDPRQ